MHDVIDYFSIRPVVNHHGNLTFGPLSVYWLHASFLMMRLFMERCIG